MRPAAGWAGPANKSKGRQANGLSPFYPVGFTDAQKDDGAAHGDRGHPLRVLRQYTAEQGLRDDGAVRIICLFTPQGRAFTEDYVTRLYPPLLYQARCDYRTFGLGAL